MGKLEVNILRDVEANPSIVEINRNNRKIKVYYDKDSLRFEGDESLFPSVPEVLQIAYPYEIESSGRNAYYDRNPKSIYGNYEATRGPSSYYAQVYTVPLDRKAILEYARCYVERVTVGVAPGTAANFIGYAPTTPGVFVNFIKAVILAQRNNAGDRNEAILNNNVLLTSDQQICIYTTDTSTNGTVYNYVSYKITEFDR